MTLKFEDDFMCYVCGKDNKLGLRLDFEHPRKGLLKSSVVFSKHHQGYKGVVHGGMMAMVLDEMMVNLAWVEGVPAVTAEITVRLKKAAKIGQKLLLEGRINKRRGRALYASAVVKDEAGETLAEAQAICLSVKKASAADKT